MINAVKPPVIPQATAKADQDKQGKVDQDNKDKPALQERSALTRMLDQNRDQQYNVFMKMFLAQVKNQNPDNPMSTHEMTQTVMSFFSAAEQAQTNKLLKQGNDMRFNEQMVALKGYLNKEITYEGDVIKFDGNAEDIQLQMPVGVKNAELLILNGKKEIIRTIPLTNEIGTKNVTWLGNSDENLDGQVMPGVYYARVNAINNKDEAVEVATILKGTVRQIHHEDGEFLLLVKGDLGVDLDKVVNVRKPASQELLGLSQTMQEQIKHYEELNKILKGQFQPEQFTASLTNPDYIS